MSLIGTSVIVVLTGAGAGADAGVAATTAPPPQLPTMEVRPGTQGGSVVLGGRPVPKLAA